MMEVIIRNLYYLFLEMPSGPPSIKDSNQFPNPPIRIGISIKNISSLVA